MTAALFIVGEDRLISTRRAVVMFGGKMANESTGSAIQRTLATNTYLHLSLATFLWAGVFVCAKQSLDVLDPIFLAAARFWVAGIAVCLAIPFISRLRHFNRQDYVAMTVLATLGVIGYNIIFLIALDLSSPLHGLVIIATTPAITALLGALRSRTAIPLLQKIGILVAFSAVMLVVFGNGQTITSLNAWNVFVGDLLFIAAAITWAVYSLKSRDIVKGRDAAAMTAGSLVIGGMLFIPIALLFCDLSAELSAIRMYDVWAILYIGLLGTVAAFILWTLGLKSIGAARTAVFLNLVPIWGTLLTALTLGQWPSLATLTATVMAIVGILIVQRH